MTEEKKDAYIGGRGKTLYKPELDEHAHNYCLMGALDEDLARFFGVSVATLNKWKKKYPAFGESIRIGKELADMQVAKSLYKRAIGYTYQQVVSHSAKISAKKTKNNSCVDETFSEDDADDSRVVKVTTNEIVKVTTKEMPPDTRAQIFWLKNRQPKLWREKHEVDDTNDGKKMSHITIFELPNDHRND